MGWKFLIKLIQLQHRRVAYFDVVINDATQETNGSDRYLAIKRFTDGSALFGKLLELRKNVFIGHCCDLGLEKVWESRRMSG